MSIRSDAYQLCKKVRSAQSRHSIRNVIIDIRRVSEGQLSRAMLDSAARQLNAQVLGYLVIDREKRRSPSGDPRLAWVGSLSTDEIKILAGVHRTFVALNRACVGQFLEEYPELELAVDPYCRFRYELPNDIADKDMLEPLAIEKMAESFRQHQAFELAKETYPKIYDQLGEITEETYFKGVFALEKQLIDAGPLSTPRSLSDIIVGNSPESNVRMTYRFLASLLSLRTSLEVLDELVYQAVLTDKLPILDDNNIIEFGRVVSHVSSTGLTILAQPGEGPGPVFDKLVLVKDKVVDIPLDLFFMESMQFQSSNDFGDTLEVHLREIDESLNRFASLLRLV